MLGIEVYKAAAAKYANNPQTGEFRWKICQYKERIGKVVEGNWIPQKRKSGTISYYKSLLVTVDNQRYKIPAHRLAWFIHYGEIPPTPLDHIENPSRKEDYFNRISNLRDGNKDRVQWSNKNVKYSSDHLGVSLTKTGKYQVNIYADQPITLGTFSEEAEAAATYREALSIWKSTGCVESVLSFKRKLRRASVKNPYKGVKLLKSGNWSVSSQAGGEDVWIGTFDNVFLAACAYANHTRKLREYNEQKQS